MAAAALVGLLAAGRVGLARPCRSARLFGRILQRSDCPGAYVSWILFSRTTSILFTASHRAVVDRTPHLDPRRSFGLVRASQRTLQLKLRVADDGISQVKFRFPTTRECKHWAGRLAALVGRPDDPDAMGGEAAPSEPTTVVLLRQRPTARYQLLGTVESKAGKRRTAEAGLEVRTAMMGADAVVDLQEEFLPDFRRTVRRLTGTAVRAVDADGRFEFRSRWYAARIAWVSKWTLLLMLINLPLTVFSAVFLILLNQGRVWMMIFDTPAAPLTSQAVAANMLPQVVQSVPIIVATHAWPVVLAALTRWLRWPQLVRPLALALAAFALRPVYLLTGLVAAAFWSGGWSGLAYNSLFLLDPSNLAILVFGLFLGRAAWRADREFRRLLPDAARSRRLTGPLSVP